MGVAAFCKDPIDDSPKAFGGAHKRFEFRERISMSEELKQKQKQTGDKTLGSLKSLF